MCKGFGAIVTRDAVYFCEPDSEGNISHSEIIRRLGWQDNEDKFIRHFVRIECQEWTMASFRFDETKTLPGWVDDAECRARIEAVLARAAPARAAYNAVCDPAWAAYKAERDPALAAYKAERDQALAAYNAVCDPAWAAYEAVCAPALAAYKAVCDQALAAYKAVCDQAEAAYKAMRDQAWAAMIAELATIPGYVPSNV